MDIGGRQVDIGGAARRLRAGGVVAFPTETVYGLGADAFHPEAIARVYGLKGRPSGNPLIVHVTGREMAMKAAAEWPAWADVLARTFWPGPLTMVLPRRAEVPLSVTAGGPTVAVRSPDHPTALALLFEFGGPLVGPSANLSGRVSPTTAEHVRSAFKAEDVLVLDGGACVAGIESTVVRMGAGGLEILRPGVIGASALERALGAGVASRESREASGGAAGGGGVLASPGMMSEHYAPRARAVLFERGEWGRVLEMAGGRAVAVISMGSFSAAEPAVVIEMSGDPAEYAARLYGALREADESGVGVIAVERPPRPEGGGEAAELWGAIADRLGRAAGGVQRR